MGRVLIVDDEETYCRHISGILERRGHETQATTSGREGMEIGSRFHPQVLIADWRLADDCTGLEVVDALKSENPELQIIIMTGYSESEAREEALTGVFKLLEKPFGLEEIVKAVEQAMQECDPNA